MGTRSWRIEKYTDPNFKITMDRVRIRTKRMIAFDKNHDVNKILVATSFDELMYSTADKQDIKPLIELAFFRDVEAEVPSVNDLADLETVRDLILYIYGDCIPKERKA